MAVAMVAVVLVPATVVAKVMAVVVAAVAGPFVVPAGAVPPRLRLVLGHAAAYARARRAAQAGTHHRATATSYRLAHGGTRCTAHRAADDCAISARTMCGDRGTGGTAQGTTDHRTTSASHGLTQHCAGGSAHATTQKGGPFVRMGGMDQGQQTQGGRARAQGAGQAGRQPGRAGKRVRHIQNGA